jgi:mannose-1-phosphate guanylyltransferase
MSDRERTWVMVLAGGAADRPESQNGHLNGPDRSQFRALPERRSLFKMTLSRARLIVPSERICALVDRAQKRYWSGSLARLSSGNVIVQPCNRGTAMEIEISATSARPPYYAFNVERTSTYAGPAKRDFRPTEEHVACRRRARGD